MPNRPQVARPPVRGMRLVPLHVCAFLLCLGLAGQAPADSGLAHFEAGDMAAAAAAWAPLARRGDRWAMVGLGHVAAIRGRDAESVRWYHAAAVRGHAAAQALLANAYLEGRGVGRDPELAYAWYHVAAASGHVKAVVARDFAGQWLSPQRQAEVRAMVRRWRIDGMPETP